MTVVNAPLDPREIEEIEELLSEIADGTVKERYRARLLAQAQAEANRAAADRKLYRDALDLAKREGYADPEAFARIQVEKQHLGDQYEQRIRAIFKRVEAKNRRRADKAARLVEATSKTARPSKRRLPQRDRQYVDLVGKAEKEGWLADRPLVLSKITEKLGRYRLPHWEKTTISLKIMAMSVTSAREGAQTINLRLSPEQCAQALISSRGAVSYMQQRIRSALERSFGHRKAPDFWFVMETDWKGKFHLHGAVVTPSSPGARELVGQALRKAGGTWASDGGQQFQQVSKSLDDPLYWASYVIKHMNVSSRAVEGKLFASTVGIRALAAGGWNQLREQLPQSPRRGS